MFTLIISLVLALMTFGIFYNFFGFVASILPSVVVLIASFIIISRNIGKKIGFLMKDLESDLKKGQVDRALLILEKTKNNFKNWQFFLSSSIDGQIGTIYYMKNQLKKAKPYLEKAFVRHWVAKAMLAVIYYKERNFKKMDEVFEKASKYNKKSGLLWSLWAYCLWRNGEEEKAIKILNTGKDYLGDGDPILVSNLLSLQNQKKMKMKGYHEQWYQFQLEVPQEMMQMRQGRIRFQTR